MKLEIKTDNDYASKSFLPLFIGAAVVSLIVSISSISVKLGNISRHYEINYFCKLLSVEQSSLNFKKLSNLLNITSKQKIWEICKEITK